MTHGAFNKRLPGKSQFSASSPNSKIDDAIENLLKDCKSTNSGGHPPETQVKIIAQAIAWEKVKHKIEEGDDDGNFNPDL